MIFVFSVEYNAVWQIDFFTYFSLVVECCLFSCMWLWSCHVIEFGQNTFFGISASSTGSCSHHIVKYEYILAFSADIVIIWHAWNNKWNSLIHRNNNNNTIVQRIYRWKYGNYSISYPAFHSLETRCFVQFFREYLYTAINKFREYLSLSFVRIGVTSILAQLINNNELRWERERENEE